VHENFASKVYPSRDRLQGMSVLSAVL